MITTGYTGYEVYTYRCRYDKETGEPISRECEDWPECWARDEVIVKIIERTTKAPETEPSPTE